MKLLTGQIRTLSILGKNYKNGYKVVLGRRKRLSGYERLTEVGRLQYASKRREKRKNNRIIEIRKDNNLLKKKRKVLMYIM